jgi:hypothetical protein
MTTFPLTFATPIVEVFLPLMITSQRKKRRKEKEKGRDKKDKESKTKKIKGDGAIVGGRAYPLLASFKLVFFFPHKLTSLHTLGTQVPIGFKSPRNVMNNFFYKNKYLAISCLSKNYSAKHKLQY